MEKPGKPRTARSKALTQRTSAPVAKQVTRFISATEKIALATFETELGGRQSLVAKLAAAQLDADGQRFLGMMADPENDQLSLAELCVRANVALPTVMGYVKSALQAKSFLLAQLSIAEHNPEVARHVMLDAIPGKRTCPTCQGLGTFGESVGTSNEPPKCLECHGSGEINYLPELGIRKVALTLGGLLSAGGKGAPTVGVAIHNHNTQVASRSGASGALDKVMQLTDHLLYGTGRDRLSTMREDADAEFVEGEVSTLATPATEATEATEAETMDDSDAG